MEAPFEQYCLVELFGHQRIIGLVTEQTIGGCAFVRVDVPALDGKEAFTKFYGNGAIYSMTPISESVAMSLLRGMEQKPINVWEYPQLTSPKTDRAENELEDESDREEDDDDDPSPF